MQNIFQILKLLKELKGFKKNSELARFFGVGASTVSTWKKRGTIPYKKLFTKCEQEGWNYQEILTGEQNKPIEGVHEASAEYTAQPNQLFEIIQSVRDIFKSKDPILMQALTLNIAAFQMTVRLSSEQKKEIVKLHDMCEEILGRVSALEAQWKDNTPGETKSQEDTIKKAGT